MKHLLAIDPGEIHNGIAMFDGPGLVDVMDLGPEALYYLLEQAGRSERQLTVVVEEFRLYPWLAKEQGFSDLPTVQVIGAIKYIVGRGRAMGLVMQPATIKVPTEKILKKKGYTFRGTNQHMRDAEMHGHYYWMSKEKARG